MDKQHEDEGPDDRRISMDQLCVGLTVELDLKWFEHPFTFSRFKIRSEEQIATLRALGLASVRFHPDLSDAAPLPPVPAPDTAATPAPVPDSPALQAKRAMVERLRVLRESTVRVERAFVDTTRAIHDIERNLMARPDQSAHAAAQLVNQIVDSILSAPELAIQVMGDATGAEESYCHTLNVTMLAMMMAREIGLPQPVAAALGLGAVLHDIGCKKVPERLLASRDPLGASEQHLFELHPQYGTDIAKGMSVEGMAAVTTVIRDHHELFDGTGYPRALKGEEIGLLARIVAIADNYDEMCNPVDPASAMTPHEALSTMFAKHRGKFDPKLLQVFIRCLGVYPPGTLVQLSNGMLGMVTTVNTARPMKPMVVVYDAGVPKQEAIVVDLEHDTELNIVRAVRPAQVPQNVYRYLSPRKRISYYFDAGQPGAGTS